MDKTWLTTDTHFNHKKMVEYCNRPENFDHLIWEGLKIIEGGDILIHLGDFCIGNDFENHIHLGALLPDVKKILIRGNHDRKTNKWYMDNGWDFVCENFQDTYFGKIILFSHRPSKDCGQFDINIHGHFHNHLPRLLRNDWVVEGEKERNEKELEFLTDKHKLLSLESTKYKPILLENFIR